MVGWIVLCRCFVWLVFRASVLCIDQVVARQHHWLTCCLAVCLSAVLLIGLLVPSWACFAPSLPTGYAPAAGPSSGHGRCGGPDGVGAREAWRFGGCGTFFDVFGRFFTFPGVSGVFGCFRVFFGRFGPLWIICGRLLNSHFTK